MKIVQKLNLFDSKVEEIRNSALLRNNFNPSISMNFDHIKGMRFKSREPDEDQLRSFLLTFRQFISKEEPVFLNHIYNICQKFLTSQELKEYLIKSRSIWKRAQKSTGMKLIYNGKELTPEFVTNLWINGFYFHNDHQKRTALLSLLPYESMLIRNQFLNFIVDATRQVLYAGNIVRIALRDNLFKTDVH